MICCFLLICAFNKTKQKKTGIRQKNLHISVNFSVKMRMSEERESKRCTSGCWCRCQCVADVLQLIAHHAGRSKHTDLCVFLLNWLSLKGSAPQLNVTTGLCFLSVSLLSMTGPHLLTLPCRLTNIPPGGRRHISWYEYSRARSILHDMKKRAEINVPATRNS